MNGRSHTLYFQIAALYLILLTAFSAASIVFVFRELENFISEVEQGLNRKLAVHLARELAPVLGGGDSEKVSSTVRRIHQLSPGIDMYTLDANGNVVRSLTGTPPLRKRIDLEPIRTFLSAHPKFPLRALDPSKVDARKIFSVSPLPKSLGEGFFYVILPGMPFETAMQMARSSYVVRGAAGVLGAIFAATLASGMILFFLLTKRFRHLILTVKRFKEGDLSERAAAEPADQIGKLGATFNEMAETIQSQVEALQRTDDARRAIAENVAHDFRTPLTSLRGYADRMLRVGERLSPEERRKHLSAILHSAGQLERLADQLALIVKLDGTEMIPKSEPFSIAELAQDAVVKFSIAAEQRGIRLSLKNPQDVPYVVGDIGLIERVLSNLIDNALKNTNDGHVEVSLPVSESHVTCMIIDTGRGITREELPRITQRFYRTRSSVAASLPGSGLGLAIVEQILALHDSSLHVDSEIEVGTRFWFDLPIARPKCAERQALLGDAVS